MYAACAFSELGWHVSADLKVWVRRIKYVLFYMSDQLLQMQLIQIMQYKVDSILDLPLDIVEHILLYSTKTIDSVGKLVQTCRLYSDHFKSQQGHMFWQRCLQKYLPEVNCAKEQARERLRLKAISAKRNKKVQRYSPEPDQYVKRQRHSGVLGVFRRVYIY